MSLVAVLLATSVMPVDEAIGEAAERAKLAEVGCRDRRAV